jgi:hypothetical protein
VAFKEVEDALKWAVLVQERLLTVDWPEKLLAHPAAAEEWAGEEDQVIFRSFFSFSCSYFCL